MRAERRQRPPAANRGPSNVIADGIPHSLTLATDVLADLDAMAEHLRGRLVVQVAVDDEKYRTHIYRSTAAAQRCVQRAAERGRRSHVTLVQMLPVGVVIGLGGGAA